MAINYDPAIIGRVFENTDPVPVSAEMISTFCTAISETNPIHTDPEAAKRGPYGKLTAPPSFAVTFRNGQHFFQHVPRFGKQGFDAGKDVEFLAPIHPGTRSRSARMSKKFTRRPGAPARWPSLSCAPRSKIKTAKRSLTSTIAS